jgi:pimeloyl-ACP methyl ester carboxylesterase
MAAILVHGSRGNLTAFRLPLYARASAERGVPCIRFSHAKRDPAERAAIMQALMLRAGELDPQLAPVRRWIVGGHSLGARAAAATAAALQRAAGGRALPAVGPAGARARALHEKGHAVAGVLLSSFPAKASKGAVRRGTARAGAAGAERRGGQRGAQAVRPGRLGRPALRPRGGHCYGAAATWSPCARCAAPAAVRPCLAALTYAFGSRASPARPPRLRPRPQGRDGLLLPTIRAPLLLLRGTADPIAPDGPFQRLTRRLGGRSNVMVVELKGANHALRVEKGAAAGGAAAAAAAGSAWSDSPKVEDPVANAGVDTQLTAALGRLFETAVRSAQPPAAGAGGGGGGGGGGGQAGAAAGGAGMRQQLRRRRRRQHQQQQQQQLQQHHRR